MEGIEIWQERLEKDPFRFKSAPQSIRDNKELVKLTLCRPFIDYITFSDDGWHINELFDILKLFEFVGPNLKSNKDFVRELIPLCSGYLYLHLNEEHRSDKQLFLYAANHASTDYIWEMANKYVSENEEFSDTLELFDEISFTDWLNQSSILKSNDDVSNLPFLGENNFIKEVIELQPLIFSNLPFELKTDREIAIKAIQGNTYNYSELNEDQKDDLEIAISYTKKIIEDSPSQNDSEAWHYCCTYDWELISDNIKSSKEFYRGILNRINFRSSYFCLNFAPKNIQDDPEFSEIMKKNTNN